MLPYLFTSAGLPRIIRLPARLWLRRAMAKKGSVEDGGQAIPGSHTGIGK